MTDSSTSPKVLKPVNSIVFKNEASAIIIIGSLLILIAVGLYFLLPELINEHIANSVQLRNDSEALRRFTNPDDIQFRIYLFEVLNPNEVLAGQKIEVRERGPFTFTLRTRKEILRFSPNSELVEYIEFKSYHFEPSFSIGDLNDVITLLNVPVVTALTTANNLIVRLPFYQLSQPLLFGFLNGLLDFHRQNLFIRRTIREFLFEGYKVEFATSLNVLYQPLRILLGPALIPSIQLENDTFGLFYGKNNSGLGPFEVYTGLMNTNDRIGHIKTFRGSTTLPYWRSKYCNLINGTDGSQFSPNVQKNKKLFIFAFDACRSISVDFEQETSVKGTRALRFLTPDNLFTRGHADDYLCSCPHLRNRNRCLQRDTGGLDVSPCWQGAPVVLSRPHFLQVPEQFRANILGLEPRSFAHSSWLDIEPLTGYVLRAKMRMGINIFLRKYPMFRDMRNILSEALVPIAWVETSAEISDAMADELHLRLSLPLQLANYGLMALIVTGAILAFFGSIWLLFRNETLPQSLSLPNPELNDVSTIPIGISTAVPNTEQSNQVVSEPVEGVVPVPNHVQQNNEVTTAKAVSFNIDSSMPPVETSNKESSSAQLMHPVPNNVLITELKKFTNKRRPSLQRMRF